MLYSRSRVSQHFTANILTVQPLRRDCSVSSDEGVQFSASQLFNSCGRGVQFGATYSTEQAPVLSFPSGKDNTDAPYESGQYFNTVFERRFITDRDDRPGEGIHF